MEHKSVYVSIELRIWGFDFGIDFLAENSKILKRMENPPKSQSCWGFSGFLRSSNQIFQALDKTFLTCEICPLTQLEFSLGDGAKEGHKEQAQAEGGAHLQVRRVGLRGVRRAVCRSRRLQRHRLPEVHLPHGSVTCLFSPPCLPLITSYIHTYIIWNISTKYILRASLLYCLTTAGVRFTQPLREKSAMQS